MPEAKRGKMGILVGGGPAPGINGVIHSATIEAINHGMDVFGIYDGFKHLMEGKLEGTPLTIRGVSRIHLDGGSILRTARANPTKSPEKLENCVNALRAGGINCLVGIGGDDTAFSLYHVVRYAREKMDYDLRSVHVPKTIDNDLLLPEGIPTFGFETARELGTRMVMNLMEDALTGQHWFLVVTMGRQAGHLALGIGKSSGATLTVIAEEWRSSTIRLQEVVDILATSVIRRKAEGRPYGVALIAEGILEHLDHNDLQTLDRVERDEHGHVRLAEINFSDVLKRALAHDLEEMGVKTKVVDKELGYELRCAAPIAYDMDYTRSLGEAAADFLLDGRTNATITIQANQVVPIPSEEMMDPNTGRTGVRLVNVDSFTYRSAAKFMIRLKPQHTEDATLLREMAACTNKSYEWFMTRYGYLLESGAVAVLKRLIARRVHPGMGPRLAIGRREVNMAHPFLGRLVAGPILADGALGTMLHAVGANLDRPVEELNLAQPDWVRETHLAYVQAGAEVITTNTFGGSQTRLAEAGLADQVRQINFRGVKLAREVREISGQPVWIAGSVGPLGRRARHGDGALNQATAEAAFREQINVLWEAGVDFLVFETFSDLPELMLGVQVARVLNTDLPIVAEMTFGNDGATGLGYRPPEVVRALAEAGADLAGVNCSMGPAGVLDVLTAMHAAAPELRLSAMPNAGFPYRAGDRVIYLSSPAYFAQHVQPFLASGAMLLGGCCGTTPAHVRAMREALDQLRRAEDQAGKNSRPTAAGPLPALPMVRTASPMAGESGEETEQATGLLQKLQAGQFVVSVEVDPPRGFSPTKMLEGARIALERGADTVNVADSPMARVRMAALALCVLIQERVGIETVLHFTTRDRSMMGLQADLIGAHALGVRNILALTGDPPNLGDQPDSRPVFDVDSIGLVRIISEFNQGNDRSGKPFGSRAAFTIAVACDPTRQDLVQEVDRFHRKVSGGAHFTMTQPIFDPASWHCFYELYVQRHGPFPVPVLVGILPLQSHRHASFLHNEVPGITLPASALARMEAAGADGRREGVKMAQELLLELMSQPKVQGVYLMPSFGRYEVACEVLDVLHQA